MPARRFPALALVAIYVAFFASGAASLVAEVTWNRMLIVVVGNSLSAAAMIISVFMGGLGLGSWLGGRYFRDGRRSLLPYAALETGIGLYVLLSPILFTALAGLFESLSGQLTNREGLTAVRMVVSVAALFLPALLMGATFPAVVAGTMHHAAARRTARSGYLYSVNTLGAAIGCFAAGYHLLFEFGVRTTLTVAFALYIVAALCGLLANALTRETAGAPAASRSSAAPASAAHPPAPAAPAPLRFLLAATFAIGFVALAYEVLLTRLSILYLGNSVSVFPLVLTAFLLGTGISAIGGTWFYGVLERRRPGAGTTLFGALALAAGVALLAAPYALLTDRVLDAEAFARFADVAPRSPLPILGIIIVPTVLLGGLLPIAIRMAAGTRRADVARGAATLYAVNTAGGVLGAGLANHWLVPHIGIHGTMIVLLSLCAAVAAGAWFRREGRPARLAAAVIAAVLVCALPARLLPDMMQLYAHKVARAAGSQRAEVALVLEGRAATVTVFDQWDPGRGHFRDMYLNGVEEASTRYWHAQLFKLLGILPVMLHDAPDGGPMPDKETAVIAFGAGMTAGSVLASDEVASLDVVDLNPDIEGINDCFTDVNGDVFHQPRFHFQNDDGRNYLVTCNRTYDVIISDSTHPRAYDSWILYTEEFYRAAKNRLRPNGVFAQWVPVLGSMQGELMRIHLNTFRAVFPHTTVWYVYGSDQAFLLATPEPLAIDVERLRAKLERLPEWFQAGFYQIDTVERVAGFFWMGPDAVERMIAGETRVNTDDFHYFDKQSAVYPLPPQWRMPAFQESALPFLHGADERLAAAVRDEQAVAWRLGRFGFYGTDDDLHRAWCANPDNENARYWMSVRTNGRIPGPEFCREMDIRSYREMLAAHPDDPTAQNALADALAAAGRYDEARPLAEAALRTRPDDGRILDTYGWILRGQGDLDGAIATLRRAADVLDDHPIVLYHLGITYDDAGNAKRAREHLSRALAKSESFPGADNARVLLAQLEGR